MSGAEPRYRDEEWLREQYLERGQTMGEIADMCDCSQPTVYNWISRYGIEAPQRQTTDRRYRDEEWLREQYLERGQTMREIADMCGCSQTTVSKWINRHGIETQGPGPRVDERLIDEKWLREQYIEREQTTVEIADMCDCAQSTVTQWLGRHGIETRSGSDYWGWGRLGVRIS